MKADRIASLMTCRLLPNLGTHTHPGSSGGYSAHDDL